MTTLFLITVVTTIIPAITQSGHQGAVVVLTLELSLPAHSLWAGVWLVRPVLAVH